MPTTKESRKRREETKDEEYLITYTRHLEKRLRNLETEKQLLDAERLRLTQELESLKNEVERVREKESKLLERVRDKESKLKIKKEKKQQLFFNLLEDQAIIERLNDIANVSTQIRLDMLRNILKISPDNQEYFDVKIFEWAHQFGFRIDGNFLLFKKDAMIEFIQSLEAQFKEWYENEKVNNKKVE